jgi:hypothetical protein
MSMTDRSGLHTLRLAKIALDHQELKVELLKPHESNVH